MGEQHLAGAWPGTPRKPAQKIPEPRRGGMPNGGGAGAHERNCKMIEQAKALRQEYLKNWNFYSPQRRAGFVRRVRNLAASIDRSKAQPGTPEAFAIMYLDHIALWLDLELQ